MEEILALLFLVTIFVGYIGLCAGVGYFAYKNDQSFLLFFALAVIFSPVPIFVVVLVLSVATGSLGASHERKERAQTAQDGQEGARRDGPAPDRTVRLRRRPSTGRTPRHRPPVGASP